MRNLLISLTFILALIISSTDAYSQKPNRGGGVDVFGASLSVFNIGNLDPFGLGKVAVEIATEENDASLMKLEYDYDSLNSDKISIPANIDNQLDGKYYVRVYLDGVLLGGEYVEF